MLPQWRSPRSERTALSESVYSQPSPPRASMLRPFSGLPSTFAWPLGRHEPSTDSPPSPKLSTAISDTPPRIPPLRINATEPYSQSPASRSPTSVRSVIDPGPSPISYTTRPLSSLNLHGTDEISPIQAPARVLDYGGHVSLDSPFMAQRPRVGSRHGSGRRERRPSQRSQRSQRQVESVLSYEDRSRRTRNEARRRRPRWIPKHSKGKVFFPAMKHAVVRTKFLHTVVSGSLLLLILIVFLALLSSQSEFTQEFRIIAILFMLVFIVLFTHSLIRLLMLIFRFKKHGTLSRNASVASQQSYARPSQPIMVTLARDEELGIGGTPPLGSNDQIKPPPPPPPAYGLWRGSVRVDPNLIHWQRVEQADNIRPLSAYTIHRPPSYSGNGENPDEQVERQILEERRNITREEDNAAWRPSLPPQSRLMQGVSARG